VALHAGIPIFTQQWESSVWLVWKVHYIRERHNSERCKSKDYKYIWETVITKDYRLN
jgi:hypothetical protein